MINPPNNVLVQYVRGRKNQKVGVVVAIKPDVTKDEVCVGWSLCNAKDEFDAVRGLEIAIGRAENGGGTSFIPHSVVDEFLGMANRAEKYFKNCVVHRQLQY